MCKYSLFEVENETPNQIANVLQMKLLVACSEMRCMGKKNTVGNISVSISLQIGTFISIYLPPQVIIETVPLLLASRFSKSNINKSAGMTQNTAKAKAQVNSK